MTSEIVSIGTFDRGHLFFKEQLKAIYCQRDCCFRVATVRSILFQANTGCKVIMTCLLLACDPEKPCSKSVLQTSLSVFHQLAKQMEAALRGLNEAPDFKVQLRSV